MIKGSAVGFVAVMLWGALVLGQGCSTEAFFTSSDGRSTVERVVLQEISAAREMLEIAVEGITSDRLCDAVLQVHDRGVEVRVLLGREDAGASFGELERLVSGGVPVRRLGADQRFAHRFAIVDRSLILTGSYAWSDGSTENVVESLLRIRCEQGLTDDPVRVYLKEFERLWEGSREATLSSDSPAFLVAPVSIAYVDLETQCIVLLNSSAKALDVSGWALSDLEAQYVFPSETVIPTNDPVRFCAERFNPTGDPDGLYLDPDGDEVFLSTPEGVIVDERSW